MRYLSFLSAAVAALFLSGCASTGVESSGLAADPPPQNAPAPLPEAPLKAVSRVAAAADTNRQATAAPAPAPSAPPASAAAKQPPQPKPQPKPKPWKVNLTDGSHLAVCDGIRVYLGFPALPAKRGKAPAASAADRRLTLAPLLKARSKPLVSDRPLRVCIDPGHGGEDSGAQSRDGKTMEKSVTLDLARRLKALLEADGAEVLMTRTSDGVFVKLEDRAAKARRWKADVFVSLHLNANGKSDPRGAETYALPFCGAEATSWDGGKRTPDSTRTFPGNSHDVGNVQLAFCIQRRLTAAAKLPDRGVRRARFVVLREAGMPAALVECGFVTNAKDLALLRTAAGRQAVARGVYEGICDFALGTMEPGLPAHVSGTGGLGKNHAAPARESTGGAPGAGAAPKRNGNQPLSFVSGGDTRVAPYAAPAASGGDAATQAARAAALKAAGL